MKIKLRTIRGQLTPGSVIDLSEQEAEQAIRAGEAYDLATAEIVERQEGELKQYKANEAARIGIEADTLINTAITKNVIAAKDMTTQSEWKKNLTGPLAAEYHKSYGEQIAVKAKDLTQRSIQGQHVEPNPQVIQAGGRPGRVQVMRTDSNDAVKAYAGKMNDARAVSPDGKFSKESDQLRREAGRIFAEDLGDLLDKGGDFAVKCSETQDGPIQANSLATLAGNLILQRSLTLLRQKLDWLTKCGTNFSAEGAKYGQGIYTRIRGVPTVVDYNTTTGWASSSAVTTDKSVTLNAHKGVQITFDTETLGSTVRNLMQEQSEPMSYALAKAIADIVAALFTVVNFPTTPQTIAKVDFNRLSVIAVKDALDTLLNPDFDRQLVLSTDYANALLQDIQVVAPLYGGVGGVASINPSNIHGFALTGSQSLNALPLGVRGLGFGPSAILVAARLPQDYTQVFPDLPPTATVEVVTEPGSGLSLQMVKFVSHSLATANMRVCLMFGAAVGQANAGVIVNGGV